MQAQWTLQTSVKLPWRPFIDVIGATEYVLNKDANQVLLCGLVQVGLSIMLISAL